MSLKSLKNQTLRNKSTINSVNLTGGASTGPVITSIIVTDSNYNNLDDTALLPAGGYAKLIGSGFASGCSAYFNGSSVTTTFVSATEVRVVIPATTAGTYNVMLFNPSTAGAIYLNLGISNAPTFTTSAGSLGTSYETTAVSTSIAATGDAPITYALYSGSLPTGVTLASNGTLSGTSPVEASSTTYSFVVQATDAQLQDTTRSFSLTISTDIVTWSTPAADFAYTLAGNEAMSNVSLSAASAAGYNITYAANTLPTGVSLSGNTIFGTPTVEQTVYTALTATAATTGRSATRYVSWSIALGDAFFEYNTLLLPGASTTFVDDASTNNFAVTIAGDTKPNSFNPYTPGYYSNYFDGTGDYLSTPNNAAFQFGTGDFTVECWVNKPTASNGAIVDVRATLTAVPWAFYVDASNYPYFYDGTSYTSTVAIVNNSWNHIVAVRTSGVLKIFVNGVQGYSASFTNTLNASGTLTIGGTAAYTTGYISNLRIVKGTAVYTTTFTPPTSPLTAIANTSLLTCQSNRFIDNSTNNFTLTVNGNTTVNSFDPFIPNSSYSTYGSGYFDGTGDYLSVAYNSAFNVAGGTFTIEAWVNITGTFPANGDGNRLGAIAVFGPATVSQGWEFNIDQTNNTLFFNAMGNGSNMVRCSYTFAQNTWYHIAMVRNGSTNYLFVNGISQTLTFNGYTGGSAGSGTLNVAAALKFANYNHYITGYISNFRIVNGTAVYTANFTPSTTPLTAIANTSLLTLQNNQPVNNSTFLDNSTNNFLVTRAGNTTQGTFSPYGGNWSNYFDGAGDNLGVNYASGSTLAGNFTIESWVYDLNPTGYGTVMGWRNGTPGWAGILIQRSGSNNLTVAINNNASNIVQSNGTYLGNQWNHVALVRVGTTVTLYVNGTSAGTSTVSGSFNPGSNYCVGTDPFNDISVVQLKGYISNQRVVNGTAIYTGNFTPPTTPLTPVTNTGLLTCQSNRIVDNSTNNFAITKVNDVSVQRFSPFNPSSLTPTSYSGYFDGTGDYLTVTYPINWSSYGSYTAEFWFYTSTIAANNFTFLSTGSTNYTNFYMYGSSGSYPGAIAIGIAGVNEIRSANSVISANSWYHIAYTYNGTTTKIYVNGVEVASSTTNVYSNNSANLTIANGLSNNYMLGYMSNLRIVQGTVVYTSNFTPSTTPLTAISGTSLLTLQSTTFIDNSTNNFTITNNGDAKPVTQNPFGFTSALTNGYTANTVGGSAYFDGSGDYLSVTNNPDSYAFGSGNFTIEMWVNFSALPGTGAYIVFYDNRSAASSGGTTRTTITLKGNTVVYYANAGDRITSGTVVTNQWYHLALCRSGTSTRLFLNGVQAGTTYTDTTVYTNATNRPLIGGDGDAVASAFTGYISDLRVIKGTALYTGPFVPPVAPLTAVQNTVLLNNFTGAGIYDAAMMNNMETVGDAKLSTAISKFGGSSMYFDGTGDWLTLPITPQTSLGPTFTIEAWIYLNNTTGIKSIYSHSAAISGAYGYFIFYTNGTNLGFSVRPSTSATETGLVAGTLAATTWTHVAVSVNNTACRLFINGTQVGSTTTVSTTTYTPVYSTVGADIGQVYPMNGYIDDLRITKGYARYTSNFTPPTSALQIK